MKSHLLVIVTLLALRLGSSPAGAQTNVYSTANVYTNVAPAGTGWMRAKVWGAGGGNGTLPGALGGAGAFATGTMAASPGDTYVVVVGQRGAHATNNLGGAGSGDTQGGTPGYLGDYNDRGQGGQASSLLQLTNNRFVLKLVAGAGGGSGLNGAGGAGGQPGVDSVDATGGQPGGGGIGGAGGGTGSAGTNYANNATTTGFTALSLAGGNGGDGTNWSGGGGGGYGGGGGGGGGSGGAGAGGGGGGSYGQTTVPGNGTQPGNSSDSDYVAGAGTPAHDGLAVVLFAPCGPLSVAPGLSNVTVLGSLNPRNLSTAWYIVYGTTTNYGNTTSPQTVPAGAGTIIVSQSVPNLAPATLYHYRLVMTNSSGMASSVDSTFSTAVQTIAYSTAGIYTSFAPLGTTGVTFKLWGAGGAGGGSGAATGGGGAFSTATLPAQVGDAFVIVVGQKGAFSDYTLGGFGSGDAEGGAPGYLGDYNNRGQGGQGSSVFLSTNNLLVLKALAGGGGGAGLRAAGGGGGQPGVDNIDAFGGQPGAAGLGGNGGAAGAPGDNYATNATTSGIVALVFAGGNGGNADHWSGGGGGGYGGGGGGGGGSGGNGAGGGGGGSYGAQVTPANGQLPPNTSDTNYVSSAGRGGNSFANGNDGLAVVIWHMVNVGTPPTLTGPTKLANGSFQFSFTNQAGAYFTALAKTNLNGAWTSLGPATEISSGHFQFTDPRATNYPMRFYKVSSP